MGYIKLPQRKLIRLKDYDYSASGAYFITICAYNRECLFGKINHNLETKDQSPFVINEYGKIIQEEWARSDTIRHEITLDDYVIMPNHFHGIIFINKAGDQPVAPTEPFLSPRSPLHGIGSKSVGSLIAGFKSTVTKRINEIRKTPGFPVWQRNYYEHVIRNENDLNDIRQYIKYNPLNWETDKEYVANRYPIAP